MKIKHRDLHRISSTAIIYKDNKYLIAQRNHNRKAFPGKWLVPGGGLEVDDYINTPKTTNDHWYYGLENSLKREIKEEVNLEVGPIKYLLDMLFIRPDGIPILVLSWYCSYKSGEVKLGSEFVDYKWVTCREARKYDLVEGMLEEIEMVDKILKGKGENSIKFNFKK